MVSEIHDPNNYPFQSVNADKGKDKKPHTTSTSKAGSLVQEIQGATGDLGVSRVARWRERTGLFKGDAGLITRLARNEIATINTLNRLEELKEKETLVNREPTRTELIAKGAAMTVFGAVIGAGVGYIAGEAHDKIMELKGDNEQQVPVSPVDGQNIPNNEPSSVTIVVHPEA
jgi:hypothetical protein